MLRTSSLGKSLVALGALLVAASVAAAEYPVKPITFVVPWKAGGRTDIVGRLVADVMSRKLGQAIAVVNRTGGRGAIGTKFVLDAPKDGYTVLVTTPGNQILGPVFRDTGFQPLDFTGIARVAADYVVLAANKDQPFASAKELIAHAKAKPGQVTFAAVKNVLPDLTAQAFFGKAGIKLKLVPGQGDAGSVQMALGGHVNLVSSSSLSAVASHIEGGTLRPLVVFAEARLPEIRDTPTAIELGYEVTGSPWTGIAVAKGVPEDVVAKLRAVMKDVVSDPQFVQAAAKAKARLAYADGPSFEKQWAREFASFKAALKQ